MGKACISHKVMDSFVSFRNGPSSNKQPTAQQKSAIVGRSLLVELPLCLLTVTALIEAVVYTAFSAVSLFMTPATTQPVKYFASLTKDSSFTVTRGIKQVAYENLFVISTVKQTETKKKSSKSQTQPQKETSKSKTNPKAKKVNEEFKSALQKVLNDPVIKQEMENIVNGTGDQFDNLNKETFSPELKIVFNTLRDATEEEEQSTFAKECVGLANVKMDPLPQTKTKEDFYKTALGSKTESEYKGYSADQIEQGANLIVTLVNTINDETNKDDFVDELGMWMGTDYLTFLLAYELIVRSPEKSIPDYLTDKSKKMIQALRA